MSRNTIINGLISLVVLIAISCSFFTLPTNSHNSVSKIISASQGGELTLPDKTVLKIPAGSLQSDTTITLSKISATDLPAAPEDMSVVGGIYDINLGTSSLQKPATLEIPFNPKLLPDIAESGQVFLSCYDEIKKEWVYAGGVVDTTRNIVVLEITHASLWVPTTWNWGAWIAVLNKLLRVSIVDWIEAVQLLTADCPQTGNYVQVDSSQARNLVQGCVEQDDIERPVMRVINPKSFFFEIKPISGGNGYPSPTLLSPGEDIKFEASTLDPSPLIIEAQLTERSGWYLVVHMVITMLPGANQFGIQGRDVACITERLADVSNFASAVESLLVGHDGAAAAESISKFMLDGDAVRRFITAADDCNFGPAPTWSLEGIRQIGVAVSTIMSATDYIANYFAGNTDAQLSFTWTLSEVHPQLDKNDLSSVVQWLNYLVKYKKPALITSLIGSNGTAFGSYAMGANYKGYNNDDEIFKVMEKALSISEPVCLGYDPNLGTLPDKAIIYFQGIYFNWAELGVSTDEDDISGFQFFKLEQGWELVYITYIPSVFMPDLQSLIPCPE